ncbi:type III secretion system outer membrane ring subunit SctC [Desulfovibrio inopinatus]|uniref:type III secretion system outer membrane ring subunit SctC n=1 Tax=Desulfovibrio inopinatus TaxID=102109 RepID=UPI0004842789|nr:type III secretion system outer membrane ring subunit SctC [Desulfovibrio inopinatus]
MRALCLRVVFIALVLAPLIVYSSAQSRPWVKGSFTYVADNVSLRDLLQDFCKAQGVTGVISSSITGHVSGNFDTIPSSDFLSIVTKNYGLSYYYDGSNVFFYKNTENKSELINLGILSPGRLMSMLQSLGVYDPRYPWREWPEGKVIFLSGPPRYVELVATLAKQYGEAALEEKVMRAFRLKHAWAGDHEVQLMDKQVTVPGMATLLREMVTGQNALDADDDASQSTETSLKLKDLTGANDATDPAQAISKIQTGGVVDTGPGSSSVNQGPRILADQRLNAVIVWDVREKMPYYAAMIRELDVPVNLVEIKAVIMDVAVDKLRELGVSWVVKTPPEGGSTVGVVGGANVGTDGSADDLLDVAGEGLNLSTIYSKSLTQIMAQVHALESDGQAKVLSRPSVLTMDNIQAQMESSQTFYVRVPGTYDTDLYKVTAGTVLRVTPHLVEEHGERKIKLLLNIEDGTPDSGETVDEIPTVKKSMINTEAIVPPGQSLIIGGQYYEEMEVKDEGIPFLKDIPYLGTLFGKETKTVNRRERIFIITPKFVDYRQHQVDDFKEEFVVSMVDKKNPTETDASKTEATQGVFKDDWEQSGWGGCSRRPRPSQTTP